MNRHGHKQHSAVYTPKSSPTELLEQNGYELLTATNGADGLRLFMFRPVDAIVLDNQLGLLDGGAWRLAYRQATRIPG